jgi:hypothetical protein
LIALTACLVLRTTALASEPFVIVSDIDDTVKISHSTKPSAALYDGFFGKKAFAGMAELYQAWVTHTGLTNHLGDRALVFLSAGPTFLHDTLWNQLVTLNHFPPAGFVLRPWQVMPDIAQYKALALERLAAHYPHPLILLGDDTEHDPEVLPAFAAAHPGKVLAVWIKRNLNRALPEGDHGFYNAFDLALGELEAGRLDAADVLTVGERILANQDPELLFPSFYYCPAIEYPQVPSGPVEQAHPEVQDMRRRVESRVLDVCSAKN